MKGKYSFVYISTEGIETCISVFILCFLRILFAFIGDTLMDYNDLLIIENEFKKNHYIILLL